ncbi:MAG: CPXCG motif-containing cysteine-rich protein [Myxococcota bacterium]
MMDSLEDETYVVCPWCFQSQLLYVDPGTTGRFIQDCDVCCRPWDVTVHRDEGEVFVHVERA